MVIKPSKKCVTDPLLESDRKTFKDGEVTNEYTKKAGEKAWTPIPTAFVFKSIAVSDSNRNR